MWFLSVLCPVLPCELSFFCLLNKVLFCLRALFLFFFTFMYCTCALPHPDFCHLCLIVLPFPSLCQVPGLYLKPTILTANNGLAKMCNLSYAEKKYPDVLNVDGNVCGMHPTSHLCTVFPKMQIAELVSG